MSKNNKMLIEVKKLFKDFERIVYYFGLWPRDNSTIYFKIYGVSVFFTFYPVYAVAIALGAVVAENFAEKMFLVMCTMSGCCLMLKIIHFYRNREDIQKLFHEMDDYTVDDQIQYDEINRKIRKFIEFKAIMFRVFYYGVCLQLLVPFIMQENIFAIKIWVPIDWTHNNIAFWIINVYTLICIQFYVVAVELSVIVWYLMLNFSIKYEMLGYQLMNLGKSDDGCSVQFKTNLVNCIESHRKINL